MGRLSLAVVACALAAPPAARAQAPPLQSLTLSPAAAEGVAEEPQSVGPFAIRNGGGRAYDVRMLPVLLGQRRDGGLFVRLDAASRRRARALIAPSSEGAALPPGASVSADALVRDIPAQRSLYGGLLFQATPKGRRAPREQIVPVLGLNARILLDPPQRLRRVRFTSEPIRAEQAGERRLAVRVPVVNRGNAFVSAGGRLTVRDARGSTVLSTPVNPVEVLPGATVELTSTLTRPLGPGAYSLGASLESGGRRFTASGSMRLLRVNEVAAASARLVSFSPPQAYRGDAAPLEATFRNRGNIPFAPRASFEVRAATGPGAGRVLERIPAQVERAAPGTTAAIRGSFDVPESGSPLEITVRVRHNGRLLDERAVSVTPTAKPPFPQRVADFATRHAIALLTLLALLLAVVTVGGAHYIRRLKAAAGGAR